jgi:hypothetical protein
VSGISNAVQLVAERRPGQERSPAQMTDEAVILPGRHARCSLEPIVAAITYMFSQVGRRADYSRTSMGLNYGRDPHFSLMQTVLPQ